MAPVPKTPHAGKQAVEALARPGKPRSGGWQSRPGTAPVVPAPYERRAFKPDPARRNKLYRQEVTIALQNAVIAGALSAAAARYAIAQLFPPSGGYSTPTCDATKTSQQTKGRYANVSERTARRHERELEAAGFLVVGHRDPIYNARLGQLRPQTNISQFHVPAQYKHKRKPKPEKPQRLAQRRHYRGEVEQQRRLESYEGDEPREEHGEQFAVFVDAPDTGQMSPTQARLAAMAARARERAGP